MQPAGNGGPLSHGEIMAAKPRTPAASDRVPIDPVAALNAIGAENEWRKNRMLLLENELVSLRRRVAEAESALNTKDDK